MTPTEYVELQAQIARQTPEQAQYQVDADAFTAQVDAMQPDIDAAVIAVADAQAALDAAIEAGQDPVPFEEALAAAQEVLAGLQSDQATLQDAATTSQQNADTLAVTIAECQALIDSEAPPSVAQQNAALAAIVAAGIQAFKEARAGTVQQNPVLVAELPLALGTAGLRAMVSDATVGPSTKFMDALGGGGTKTVPVYSDGLVWRVG